MCQHILILGGDMRQYYMAKFLAKENFAISYFGQLFEEEEEKISKIRTMAKLKGQLEKVSYDYVLLPMPVGEVEIRGSNQQLKTADLPVLLKGQKTIVMGGKIPKTLCRALEKENIEVLDFMDIESIAIMNGRLTAENAIIEAVMMSDTGVTNAKSLVIGYGRCGQMLAHMLKGMGSYVTVAEPDEDRAMLAVSYGYKVEEIKDLSTYQFVFQTAPKSNVLSDRLLVTLLDSKENDNGVILDISSQSDSIDMDFVQKHHMLCKRCPGLPGKYTARSAGELLGQFVKKYGKDEQK